MSNLVLKVLIVEDEIPAREKLERYLNRYSEGIEIKGKSESIEDAVNWLTTNQSSIDLIFMDIQLKDGLSFDIFRKLKVQKPVIFITAYNEFALEAFKMNGIDYILKPITFTDLSDSLKKVELLGGQLRWSEDRNETLVKTIDSYTIKNYKNRFMVKSGDHIKSITTDQISILFADGRDVYLITNQLRKFIIDYTLENLEEILDPKVFYRVNRSYIINISSIQDVIVYSNSRLKISPTIIWEQEIIVSREKVNKFKEWFDGTH